MKDVVIDDIRYHLDGETKTATVVRREDFPYSGVVLIPEMVTYEGENYVVTRIGKRAFAFDDQFMFDCYEENENVGSELIAPSRVEVPRTVTVIEDEAFYRSFDLVGVTLHTENVEIGERVFDNCRELQIILVPEGKKDLYNHKNLEPYRDLITDTVAMIDGVYYHLNPDTMCAKVISRYPAIRYNWKYYADHVVIPAEVEYRGNKYRVKEISAHAFANSAIQRIDIADGVERIGDYAFDSCEKLLYVDLPDSVHTAGKGILGFCEQLRFVRLSDNMTRLEEDALCGCENLQSVVMGKNIRYIGKQAFSECKSLSILEFPETVEEIGEKALEGCARLSEVTVPNNVRKLYMNVFDYCDDRLTITLGDSIQEFVLSEDKNWDVFSIDIPYGMTEQYCQNGLETLRDYICEMEAPETHKEKQVDSDSDEFDLLLDEFLQTYEKKIDPEDQAESQMRHDSDEFNRLLDEFIQATLTEQVDDETIFTQEDEENEMLTSTGDEETPITPDSDDFERWLEGFIQCKLAEEDDEESSEES